MQRPASSYTTPTSPTVGDGVDQPTPEPFSYTTLKHGEIKRGLLTAEDLSKVTTDERFGEGPLVIFVSPRVDKIAKPPSEKKRSDTWKKERQQLEKDFCIDKFFLTESGYESNGFFRFHSSEKDAWGCRLLIKELGEVPHRTLLNSITVRLYKCLVGSTFDFNEQTSDIVAIEVSDRRKVTWELVHAIEVEEPTPTNTTPSENIRAEASINIANLLHSVFINHSAEANTEVDKVLAQRFQRILKWSKGAEGQILHRLSLQWRLKLFRTILDFLLFDLHKDHCVLEKTVSIADIVRKGKSNIDNNQSQGKETSYQRVRGTGLRRVFTTPNSSSQISHGQRTRSHKDTATENQKVIELRDLAPKTSLEEQTSTADKALANHLRIKHTYHWLFLSFWAITLRTANSSHPVLLCFDDATSRRFRELIEVQLSSERIDPRRSLAMLSMLVEEILHISDESLWGFRKPVRDFEKRRQEHLLETSDDMNQDGYRIHFEIHELSRHLIHSQETLNAAQTVIEAMKGVIHPRDSQLSSTLDLIQFSLTFVQNLKLRAGAFVERIHNETALAFDIMNFKQLQSTRTLLQESRSDGRDFNIGLAIVSILFLPGTFFSGLFGLDYFGASRKVFWYWLICTLSFTAFLGLCLIFRHPIKQKLFGRPF